MGQLQVAVWVIALLVALALVFDFMNGFHDAANSIATVVSAGVLKPRKAVLFAAFFNVAALFVFHLSVAATARSWPSSSSLPCSVSRWRRS
jgi:PiT family inorganic phosphate transporter